MLIRIGEVLKQVVRGKQSAHMGRPQHSQANGFVGEVGLFEALECLTQGFGLEPLALCWFFFLHF